eukprot:6196429-Pleurochrysis_carterae.AAC.2
MDGVLRYLSSPYIVSECSDCPNGAHLYGSLVLVNGEEVENTPGGRSFSTVVTLRQLSVASACKHARAVWKYLVNMPCIRASDSSYRILVGYFHAVVTPGLTLHTVRDERDMYNTKHTVYEYPHTVRGEGDLGGVVHWVGCVFVVS